MSLQVWLPLNGHIKNYGLSDATASLINSPSVVASNRGECYNFNPNNENNQAIELIVNDMPRWVQNEFSVAFWIYHRETAGRSIIFGSHDLNGAYNFNIEKLATSNALRVYMEEKPDLTVSACILDENTWTHVAVTKSATELIVYKNGAKVYSRTHASTDLWKNSDSVIYRLGRDDRSNTTALNGMLNDFRIYDHILSQKEIKNLSQGLLLNYSFDDAYIADASNENYVFDNSGMGRHGKIQTNNYEVSTDTALGNYSLHLNGSDSGDKSCVIGDLNLSNIKTYTFASYIKINTWGKQTSGIFSASTSNATPKDYTTSPIHHRDSYFDIAVEGNTSSSTGATYQRLLCNSSDIPAGQWKHLAVTFDGQTATLYIDGAVKRSVAFSSAVTLAPCKYIFLSYSCAGGANRVTNANWSDFRVYSTCLSADDIKKLAFNHVAVDKKSNLYCYGLNEESGIEHNITKESAVNVGVKEMINIYPGSQFNAAQMNVTYNFATDIFKDYGFNTCTKFAANNTSTTAFMAYSYLLPTSYYTPGATYSFACYAYVSSDCNANFRINLEQSTTWVKNYQGTTSNINDTTKDQVIKVTGTIQANSKGQIYMMFYPNPNQANIFTKGYFLIAGLTIVQGSEIPHPTIEKTSANLIKSLTAKTNMTANGTYSLIGDFSKNADTYSYFNTEQLELDRMYRLTFNVSNLASGSTWDWRLWNSANYNLKVDRNGMYSYTFIPKASLLPANYSLTQWLWDDGSRVNPTGSVYFNDFKLVECIAQPHHGIFETNKAAIHSAYIEINNIYEN